MPDKKKPLPAKTEADIKRRYMLGQKPKTIGPDFGLTANQVSELARRRGWKPKKAKLDQKIEQEVEAAVVKELELDSKVEDRKLVRAAVSFILADIANALKTGTLGINAQDGEGLLNPIYKDTWKEALKEHRKPEVANGAETSRPVYRSIYQTSNPDTAPARNFASKAIISLESGDPGAEEWEDDGSD